MFAAPVSFNHRGGEWAAQAVTGSVAYDLAYNPDKQRWYLNASWKIPKRELPSLYQLRALNTLAVDLNADHIAGWVIAPDGNPVGDPITITYTSNGTTGQNNASLRYAIKQLLDIAVTYSCGSIACEDLNFADARATGRETMGTGKRGKQFRQTVSSMPTAKSRDLLVSMAYKAGVAIIAVDPAYTSKWGREHWYMFLNYSRRAPSSSHHAAAVVIGRRALTLTAKRKSNTRDDHTGIRQKDEATTQLCCCTPVKGLPAKPTSPRHDTTEAREHVKRTTPDRPGCPDQLGTITFVKRGGRDADTKTRNAPTSGHRNRSRCPPRQSAKANYYQQTERFNAWFKTSKAVPLRRRWLSLPTPTNSPVVNCCEAVSSYNAAAISSLSCRPIPSGSMSVIFNGDNRDGFDMHGISRS